MVEARHAKPLPIRICSRRFPDTHSLRCGHMPREGVDRQVSVGRGTPHGYLRF